MVVVCENYYCGHWKDRLCTLEDIQLDRVGNCIVFQHIPVDEALLEANRAAFAADYQKLVERDIEADRELLRRQREKQSGRRSP